MRKTHSRKTGRRNEQIDALIILPTLCAAVLLIANSAFSMGNKGVPPQQSGGQQQQQQQSGAGKAAETTGQVAGHSGTGQTMGEIIDYAAGRGNVTEGMSNQALKKHAKTYGGPGKLSSKNGSLGTYRKKVLGQASKWKKVTTILKGAAKAIDVVSPASRLAGHIYEGDWSGFGFAAADEMGKKGATWGGGAAGTAAGGPVGSVIGAAAADELYTRNVSPEIDTKAQQHRDYLTMTSQYTPENYERYQDMQRMKDKLSPSEYRTWLQTQKRQTRQATRTSTQPTIRNIRPPRRPCTCP